MNKNILPAVCVFLAAIVVVVHFYQPVTNPDVAGEVVQPTDDPPVDTTVVPESPVAEAAAVVQTEQDPQTVTDAVTTTTHNQNISEGKDELLRQLRQWAAQDSEAALAAAMELPKGEERNDALSYVCFGLAQNDPADAVKLAEDLHLDQPPAAVMEDLVQQWAGKDLIASLTWVEAQPTGAPRDEYTTRIAFVMSQSDPSNAAALVMNRIPRGPAQDEAIVTVLHQWANRDMMAAANWANGMARGPIQERVIDELNGILEYQQALRRP